MCRRMEVIYLNNILTSQVNRNDYTPDVPTSLQILTLPNNPFYLRYAYLPAAYHTISKTNK